MNEKISSTTSRLEQFSISIDLLNLNDKFLNNDFVYNNFYLNSRGLFKLSTYLKGSITNFFSREQVTNLRHIAVSTDQLSLGVCINDNFCFSLSKDFFNPCSPAKGSDVEVGPKNNTCSLSVLLLNIQSMRNKCDEFLMFLESIDYPTIVLITEHWLRENESGCPIMLISHSTVDLGRCMEER